MNAMSALVNDFLLFLLPRKIAKAEKRAFLFVRELKIFSCLRCAQQHSVSLVSELL